LHYDFVLQLDENSNSGMEETVPDVLKEFLFFMSSSLFPCGGYKSKVFHLALQSVFFFKLD
jgi:hypothetical protein